MIDGVRAVVVAEPGLDWTVNPARLALFPEGSGTIRVELRASATFPAGVYEIPIELRSEVGADGPEQAIHLTVEPAPGATIGVEPLVGSGKFRSRFSLRTANTGNTPLELALGLSDADRAVRAKFGAPVLKLGPGDSATTKMTASSRGHLLGNERSHQLSFLATAVEVDVQTKAVFRQQPIVARGARTAMILAAIVALWAAIFVVVLNHALAGDPLTKEVPASFYASIAKSVDHSNLASLGGSRAPVGLTSANDPPPAGAVPKSGVVIGVGGTIKGTVDAASTKAGIGRINVEVVQLLAGSETAVASAATAADGTYSVAGLLPGTYKLAFEAQGYQTIWYPDAASEAAAEVVTVNALATTGGVNVTISGLPGSITGLVDTGVKPAPPVTVTVVPDQGGTAPIATVKTGATGAYTIEGLPTPGTYDLSFTSPSYQVASATDELSGGEALIANTVTLAAANGSISGTVVGSGVPLGGVTITAQANGQTYTSATPTTGPVGQFSIVGLPSPATYLITFVKAGYGTRIIGEQLGPGQALSKLTVSMAGGAGDITGEVLSTTGVPLGGATVTVDGSSPPVATQTLTAGTVGTYSLSGLPTPGTYTLSFSDKGYESETLAVPLASSGSADNVNVRLPAAVGTITGKVTTSAGAAVTGASVTATNGTTVTTTTTTSAPPGGFLLTDLPPGSYSVTFSLTGYRNETYLVVLGAGQQQSLSVKLAGS